MCIRVLGTSCDNVAVYVGVVKNCVCNNSYGRSIDNNVVKLLRASIKKLVHSLGANQLRRVNVRSAGSKNCKLMSVNILKVRILVNARKIFAKAVSLRIKAQGRRNSWTAHIRVDEKNTLVLKVLRKCNCKINRKSGLSLAGDSASYNYLFAFIFNVEISNVGIKCLVCFADSERCF